MFERILRESPTCCWAESARPVPGGVTKIYVSVEDFDVFSPEDGKVSRASNTRIRGGKRKFLRVQMLERMPAYISIHGPGFHFAKFPTRTAPCSTPNRICRISEANIQLK